MDSSHKLDTNIGLLHPAGLPCALQNGLRQRPGLGRAIGKNLVYVIQIRRQLRAFLTRFGEIIPVVLE